RAVPAPRPPARVPVGLPASVPRVIGSGEWVCPVQGPRAFSNDWGQPRSGGRRHQGNDILSPRGTPVVANVGGNVRPHSSGLGGISYYLSGNDGNTYFGTHLDRLSGASGRVSAGTVIGYVGNSGNARGGPTHLHFEIHPGGGAPVNPYPTVARYC
ncbi:MAG: M23 family metallopeptidase, partial [Actinomycetota bacterium]|nr:M23 family metallopeptidase [Actinomycetota bacterium]